MSDLHALEALPFARLLSSFGVPCLAKALGRELTEALEIIGRPVTATELAIALAVTKGGDALRSQDLRLAAMEYLGPEVIAEAFNEPPPANDEDTQRWLNRLASFHWGDNRKTRVLVEALSERSGVPAEELIPSPKAQPEASLRIHSTNALFRYQDQVRRDALAVFESGERRLVAQMPTGSGKTRTTMELITDLVRRNQNGFGVVVWLAHSDELCEQAVEGFSSVWQSKGTHDVSVIRLWGGRTVDEVPSEAFVVTSFQTAYEMLRSKANRRSELFLKLRRACSCLVVDEAHQATAPTYSAAIDLLANESTRIVGLTATPGRHHIGGNPLESDALAKFFHGNRVGIRSPRPEGSVVDYLQELGVLSKLEIVELHHDPNLSLTDAERLAIASQLDIPATFLKKLAGQRQRTAAIVGQIQHVAIELGHQTIVFATSKDHSDELAMLLQLSGCETRSVTSSTPSSARSEATSGFRNGAVRVLVNYGVLTTGFDAPNTTCVVIARPTTSIVLYSQMIGRGIRGPLMGGSEACLLVDVRDNISGLPGLPSAYTFFDQSWDGVG